MPREYIHWKVALQTLEELVRVYPQSDFTRLDRAMLLLGAVAHDAPYFYRLGRGKFSRVAELLHGTHGDDTLEPLALFCEAACQAPSGTHHDHRAFLLGLITHYSADIVLHPAVYYFTGNYYDSDPQRARAARTQHRLLETCLDNHCALLWPNLAQLSLRAIVSELGGRTAVICESLGRALPRSEQWLRAFFDFAACQRLFHSASAAAIMRRITALLPSRLSEYEALYSAGKRSKPGCFEARFRFENPIDGKWGSANLEELLQQAIEMSVGLAETVLVGSSDFAEIAQRVRSAKPGLSLSFGRPNAPVEQAHYFSSAPSPFLI
ncbi:MAG: zinc dependent phospholipase C family protein [Oligoflexia bacterium]|nr:zinc dependent phospholipase C family protein [Oligoflexia bacterium]